MTRQRWLRGLLIAWAAPCSAIGLCLGAIALLLGGRARRVAGALEFSLPERGPSGRALAARLPFAAITFGHVVVGVSREQLARLRAHERVHVRQYEALGPLFLLAYPLASLIAAARGLPAYRGNWFEVQACREPLPVVNWVQRGGRRLLREPEAADAGPLFRGYARDTDVCRYVIWTRHMTVKPPRRRSLNPAVKLSSEHLASAKGLLHVRPGPLRRTCLTLILRHANPLHQHR